MDLEAIEKWRTKDGEYAERAKELEEATAARDEVRCCAALGHNKICGAGCTRCRPRAWHLEHVLHYQ